MTKVSEVVQEREQFYVPASFQDSVTGCGDERPGLDEAYINIYGGPGLNVAWNLMVLQEAAEPGSVHTTFAEKSGNVTTQLVNANIPVVVHSDTHTEHGPEMDLSKDVENDLGCGYAKLRQAISRLIGERGQEIINTLVREKPEKYASEAGRQKLQKYIDANARLAEKNDVFTSGRDVARSAEAAGATTMVVDGEHVSEDGILNGKPNSTIHTKKAWDAGKPTYNHNTWAAVDAFKATEEAKSGTFTKDDFEAANDVDAVGTMLALNVKNIGARR